MVEQQKILIVDDERFNINVLADLLKPDYKIMAVKNGKQALKAANITNSPDLILLDIMMPEMDGYEVCRRLKAEKATRDIPVIFITAMGETSDETKGFELGAVDYITKPISPPIVQARVKTHLALKRNMKELQHAYRIIESQKERMQEELDVAHDIQMSMVPQTFPPFPERDEFSIHAALIPAREVGGDFYDFFFLDENNLCFCIGDVSGKGVPAALFMAVTQTLIKARGMEDFSTASIITSVNEELRQGNQKFMFVTIFIGILNILSGELTYTSAGHNPTYIRHKNGEMVRLDEKHGPVVGVSPGLAYKEDSIQLSKGDMVFAYTDGIPEARNTEKSFFGDERLSELLISRGFDSSEDVVEFIVSAVNTFEEGADQADDITAMAITYLKEPEADAVKRFELKISNDLGEIDTVKKQFTDFSEEVNIPTSVRRKFNLIFDELLNNVISYAFHDGEAHDIFIYLEMAGERLILTIVDDGMPFNPFAMEPPDTTLTIEKRHVGGLGIHLVHNLMDRVIYQRRVDTNVVTMVKYFTREE